MKRTTAHVQQQLALTVHESRSAKLERLLSLTNGRVLKASRLTFDAEAANRATELAKSETTHNDLRRREST